MKGFKNTTRMVTGHHNVPASQFSTFGKSNPGHRLATGGLVNKLAGGGSVERDFGHASPVKGRGPGPDRITDLTVHGNANDGQHHVGHAAVHREVPSTVNETEHGGRAPLNPGYGGGGRARHFHVHKHYYQGGKVVKSEHQSYPKNLAGKAGKVQDSHRFTAHRVAGGFGTRGQPGRTRDRLAKGGSCGETGETRNKLAKGGKWIQGAIKHPGALHRTLGVPQGKKIPAAKLAKAAHSSNPTTRRRAALAKTLKGLHKAKGGHIHDNTKVIPPNYATGGTINRLAAGGALYHKGGHSREMSEHLESEAPRGHKGMRELIQRGGK
jgi:hypothetical protein